jgi:hypothetical protein
MGLTGAIQAMAGKFKFFVIARAKAKKRQAQKPRFGAACNPEVLGLSNSVS